MKYIKLFILTLAILGYQGCQQKPKTKNLNQKVIEKKESIKKITQKKIKSILLNDKNAIPFFYDYAKKNKENKVRILTRYGNIEIEFLKKYHITEQILFNKERIFDGTMFHSSSRIYNSRRKFR